MATFIALPVDMTIVSGAGGQGGGATSKLDGILTPGDGKFAHFNGVAGITLDTSGLPQGVVIAGASIAIVIKTADDSAGASVQMSSLGNGSQPPAGSTTYVSGSLQLAGVTRADLGSSLSLGLVAVPPGKSIQIDSARATIIYKQTPSAPTLLTPVTGATIATLLPVFEGEHNDPDDDPDTGNFEGDPMTAYHIEVRRVEDNSLVWSSGQISTGMAGRRFTAQYGTSGQASQLVSGTQYRWRAYTVDMDGTGAWSDYFTFTPTINVAPTATQGSPINGVKVSTLTPTFVFSFTDPNPGDVMGGYEIQVRPFNAAPIWTYANAATAQEATAGQASVVYDGPPLVYSTQATPRIYEWRVRVQDQKALYGAYSGWADFEPATVPDVPTVTSPVTIYDDLTPPIAITHNPGAASSLKSVRYRIYQGNVRIYDSGVVITGISGDSFLQNYGANNPSDSPTTPPALNWATTYFIEAQTTDVTNAVSSYTPLIPFQTQAPPTTPTNLTPGGNAVTGDTRPTLRWKHNDPDASAQEEAIVELRRFDNNNLVTGYPRTIIGTTQSDRVPSGSTLTANPATKYKWTVKTRATPNAGYGPVSVSAVFTVAVVPVVTIATINGVAPPNNITLNAPTPTVVWTYVAGTAQASYRVQVYANDQVTLVYDSGPIVGAATSFQIPSGFLLNGFSYYVDVAATDTLGQTASDAYLVSTSWAVPPTIQGLQAQAIISPLPNVYLTWLQSNEPLETFIRYNVWRRITGDPIWVRIGRIGAHAQPFFNDYTAQLGTEYRYRITQTKDVSGESVDSAFVGTVTATLNTIGAFLHDVSEPSYHVRLKPSEVSEDVREDISYVQTWGRAAPTPHIGDTLSSRLGIGFSEQLDPQRWIDLRNLHRRQVESGAQLCFRDSFGRKIFCILQELSRRDRVLVRYATSEVSTYTPGFALQETYYDEAQ